MPKSQDARVSRNQLSRLGEPSVGPRPFAHGSTSRVVGNPEITNSSGQLVKHRDL